MDQAIESLLRKWHALGLWRSVHHIPRTPEMLASQAQTIRACWFSFVIPGAHWHRDLSIMAHWQGQQDDEREQASQDRGGPCNGLGRPLALGFQPEMGSTLLKGNLD
jgi:hypothetical protein